MSTNIHSYIKEQESAFEQEIQLGDNWWWNFRNHVQMIFHLVNDRFFTGENDWTRAFKNIMEPLIDLANWTEDIEVKDIVFYIEGQNGRALSFLVKKYHDEVFVKENNIDEHIDEITEEDNTYGGYLAQQTNGKRPETLKFTRIAFCDQTNMLGGPLGFKFTFTPDGIRKMASKGWGDKKNGATISLDELATLANDSKDVQGNSTGNKNKTSGKVINVYLVRGNLPEAFLLDNDNMEDVYNQVQVVAFYTDKKGKEQNCTLYRRKGDEGTLKFFTAKPVDGRALGRGVGERLLHPQIWTNFLTIHKTALLEAGAKTPLVTDDETYTNRNKIQDMENLEVTTIQEGRMIQLIKTASPESVSLLNQGLDDWFQFAQLSASAQDPILGVEPVSGTTFRGQERTVAQGRGPHDRKRGKRAKFIEEEYRDWFIPDMVKEILKGQKFLATLTAEELSWVSEQLATNHVNKRIKKSLMDGKVLSMEEIDQMRKTFKEEFSKNGNRRMIEILKGEFEGIEIKMGINVANKQKDLANLSDKLLSIFQFIFSNPQAFQQAMQIPALAKSFHDILEFSGLNQADFLSLTQAPTASQAPVAPQQPAQPVSLNRSPVEA